MSETVVFATVSLHRRDTIRFIQFPEGLAPLLRNLLEASWTPGIREEKIYGGCALEFRMNRRPFGLSEDIDTVNGRRLVRDIFDFLWVRGWRIVESLGHSQNKGTKDTLIFRRDDGGDSHVESSSAGIQVDPRQPRLDWMVVAMYSSDKIRFILDTAKARPRHPTLAQGEDGDNELETPEPPAGQLVTGVKTILEKLHQLQSGSWTHSSYEFKLKGRPWGGMGEETVKSRVLLLQLLALFDSLGWRSYAAVSQGTEFGDFKRPDTWYFVQPVDWVAGSPFNDTIRVSNSETC
ncbi:hypothetical protein B0T16DRAFT_414566 [Cercophora newfieldiana]|uniref:Uncharacterized protein n=1 Tax=Cercophora newfieldiana TaxID=92897 RepID=A0AA39Y781_9PEZI|nr:hypothetical protein B0T16DRAFT_414566 [Cercophora newfieldiana]